MTSSALLHNSPPLDALGNLSGHVLALNDDGTLRIRCSDAIWNAQIAASCLLAPEVHDEVLLAPLPDGRAFVLAVLVRRTRQDAPRPALLRFPHGVRVESAQPVELHSHTSVRLSAPQADVNAARLDIHAGEIAANAAQCSFLTQSLRLAGERLEQTFGKFFAHLGQSVRMIGGHDETQAHSARLAVAEQAVTQAKSINHTATDMVRIDASQVHIS